MATETTDVASTNEYPDIVGAKPENPYLAAFRPYLLGENRACPLAALCFLEDADELKLRSHPVEGFGHVYKNPTTDRHFRPFAGS